MTVAAGISAELGEVFTRRWVVEVILDLVGYTSTRNLTRSTLVEPSVGSGAFIGPVVERLAADAARRAVPFEDLADAVRGFDLQQQHVDHCRLLVVEILCRRGARAEVASWLANQWIHRADFLLDDVDIPADFVVGNPPYIRSDNIESETAEAYRARWSTMWGRADIFIGFFERSLLMLRPHGKLGFICADRWMRNSYGARLRQLVTNRFSVEALWQMHDVSAFQTEVSAYPAITILENGAQGSVTVLDTTAAFDAAAAGDALAFHSCGDVEGHGEGWVASRLDTWFEGDDLWPTGGALLIKLLEELNESLPLLEETGGDTRISIGVASGADKAFVVEPDSVDVEQDRLLPLVMADDIRGGVLSGSRKVLINPWDQQGRLVDLSVYPRMARSLDAHPAVRQRFVARRDPESWHRTIDKVRPGLAARPKLLLQDLKAQITPVLEPGGLYPHHNLYYVVSTGWDLEVLGGLLLSGVAEAFIQAYGVKMRGGTLRFQAQYLRMIRVPEPESIEPEVADSLRTAFRTRDRDAATRAAELAYGLQVGTMKSVMQRNFSEQVEISA